MDFNEIILILRRRWPVFLVSTALALMGFLASLQLVPFRYSVESQVLQTPPLPANLEALKSLGLLQNTGPEHLLPLLTSPELGWRVAEKLQESGDRGVPSGEALAGLVTVKKVDGTNYLRLSVTGEDPALPRRILVHLIDEGDRFWRERVAGEVDGARAKLERWKAEEDESLAGLRGRLEALRSTLGIAGLERPHTEEVKTLGESIEKRRARAEELAESKRRASEEIRLFEEPAPELTSENIDAVIGQLPVMTWFRELNEKLVKDEIKLLATLRDLTPLHPDVQALQREVDADKRLIQSVFEEGQLLNQYLEKVQRIVRGDAERKRLAKMVELRVLSAVEAANAERLEGDLLRLEKLRRVRNDYQDLMDTLERKERSRRRLEEASAEITLAARSTGRILTAVNLPAGSSRQGRTTLQLLPFLGLLATLVGGLAAFIRETQDDRIHGAIDVLRRLGCPPVLMVPRIRRCRKAGGRRIPGTARTEGIFEDGLRRLLVRGGDLRTVLVTGVGEGAGRSLVAAELARAAARLGRRVALIDADGRRPVLHERFGISGRYGLSDLLSGELGPRRRIGRLSDRRAEALRFGAGPDRTPGAVPAGAGEDLLVVPAGPLRTDLARLLESHAFGALLEELAASRDLVIIDSAPLDLQGDALSIAPRVDGVVLVARCGRTRASALGAARKDLEDVGGNVLGLVLNGAGREPATLRPAAPPVRRKPPRVLVEA